MKTVICTTDDDGTIRHYNIHNHLHRTDGPADGSKEWAINGMLLTNAQFLKHPLCAIK